jgi:hypothetical protein
VKTSIFSALLATLLSLFGAHHTLPNPLSAVAPKTQTATPLAAFAPSHTLVATSLSAFPSPATATSSSSKTSPATPSQNVKQPSNTPAIPPKTQQLTSSSATTYVTQDQLTAAIAQATNALREIMYAQSANSPAVSYSGPSGVMTTAAFAPAERIDQLTNTSITNANGLADADIPDGITASNYLPLSGGTLTTASSSQFSIFNTAYFGATATSTFNSAGALTLAAPLVVPSGGTGWSSLKSGYIPFGNGSSALATASNLFWDATNSRLGISNSTPSFPLEIGPLDAAVQAGISLGRSSWTGPDNGHGVGVVDNYNSVGHVYAAYDDQSVISGTGDFLHHVGFQARAIANNTGNTARFSNFDSSLHTLAGATIGVAHHYYIQDDDDVVPGSIDTEYGLYIGNLRNATTNYGIYSSSSSTPSYFAGYIGLGTINPLAKINIGGAQSVASWTTTGVNLAINSSVLTDTTGSGAITTRTANSIGVSTFAASNAETITNGTSLYIGGPPNAGTNVSITSPTALYVNSGNVSFGGSLTLRSGQSATSWTTTGLNLSVLADKLTDTSSNSGSTIATRVVNSLGQTQLAFSTGTSTITDAATLYVAAAPRSDNASSSVITNTYGILMPSASVFGNGVITNAYGLTINSPTGATNNYAATFLGGNVGIGTSSPSSILNVFNSNPVLMISDSRNTTYNVGDQLGSLDFTSDDTSGALTAGQTRARIAPVFDNTSGSQDGLAFSTFSGTTLSERLRIDHSGNVGIGTSTPNAFVEVSYSNSGTDPTTFTNGTSLTITNRVTTLNAFSRLAFRAQDTNGAATSTASIIAINTAGAVANKLSGDLAFLTLNQGTFSEKARVTAAGNVGVATTTPWRTLSVTGTVGFDGLGAITGTNSSVCLDSNKQVVYSSNSDSCASSLRATKHDIQNLDLDALAKVIALQPVSFIYNNDASSTVRYGFIAEDTAAVDTHLATYDQTGAISGIDDRSIISIVVKAIQQLATTVAGFADNFVSAHITATTIQADDITANHRLCVGSTCVTEDQLKSLLTSQGVSSATSLPQTPSPSLIPDATSSSDSAPTPLPADTTTSPSYPPDAAASSTDTSSPTQ